MTSLAGTGELTRLALRRDRIMLAAWLYALVAFAFASAAGTKQLYPTELSRVAFAAGAGSNRTTIALYGPARDLPTLGGLATWKMSAFGAVLVAVLSLLLVVRHTRADEEAGRLELVSAGVVGRYAALTAGLLVALTANLIVAFLVALGLLAGGLPGGDSVIFGLGLAAVGCVFAAVAAVTAQLAEGARTARGIAISVLAIAYLLRAVGDASSNGTWTASLSWASPIGWAQQVRPFGPVHWWVFLIPAAFVLVVTVTAFALAGRRDVGAGLLPARPGPAVAGSGLRGPFTLAWRLQRGSLLAWAAGFAVYGAAIGGIADGIGALVGQSRAARDLFVKMGGHSVLVDAFLAATMGIMGLIAAVYAVQAVLRMRSEETGLRADPVLATAVGRIRWAFSHVVVAVAGPAVLLTAAGLAAGLAHGARTGQIGTQLPRVLGAALVQLPATWVLAGLTLALFGLVPRLATVGWAAVVAFLLLGELGPLLNLKQWAMDISPFTHVPKLPGAVFTATPVIWLTIVAALLACAGLVSLRQRDIG